MTGVAFDAWFTPEVEPKELATIEVGELTCRYPVPGPDFVARCVASLREAAGSLRGRPVAEIVTAVDRAAGRLADPADPIRLEADRTVAAATGYSPAMTRLVLDRMAADWRAERLEAFLRAELGNPEFLDGFRPVAAGRRARAYGPSLAFQVFAGNVPGVAVTALVRMLLAKAPSLGKLASGQPVLAVLFARALESADPDLARALALTYWPGGAEDAERRAVLEVDTVVVYGGSETVAAYRKHTDESRRLVVHGPRFSIGLIGADALDEDRTGTARAVARAVAAFDQHGCVSPHALWVEDPSGTATAEFAAVLAEALDAVEKTLPRGRISPGEASAIQQERAAAELKGHAADAPATQVLASEGTRWTVIFDPEPVFRPSCLNRFLRVHPIQDLDQAIELITPVGRWLQSVAVAGAADRREQLAHRLAAAGASRITTFDRLPWPSPDWHHDGQEPLRELLRWVDVEL